MQRLLDFPIRQTFEATLVAYCGYFEELCHYAGGGGWGGVLDGTYVYCCLKWTDRTIISKKISNDQELIQSDPTAYPQNQKGNN